MEFDFPGGISLCMWGCKGHGKRCSSHLAHHCPRAGSISLCPYEYLNSDLYFQNTIYNLPLRAMFVFHKHNEESILLFGT